MCVNERWCFWMILSFISITAHSRTCGLRKSHNNALVMVLRSVNPLAFNWIPFIVCLFVYCVQCSVVIIFLFSFHPTLTYRIWNWKHKVMCVMICDSRLYMALFSSAQATDINSSKTGPIMQLPSSIGSTTPCPRKKEASSFSTISLAFLDRFS